jgi:acyl carrier protein
VPRTPTEEIVCKVFAEVLGLERVGATDSFFDLGGHSLSAMRITARLNQAIGQEISLKLLFSYPEARNLAAQIDKGVGMLGDQDDVAGLTTLMKDMIALSEDAVN